MFGVKRGHAARARRRDRLLVDVILHVAAREHARYARLRAVVRDDVAVSVEFEWSLNSDVFGVWPIATNTPVTEFLS